MLPSPQAITQALTNNYIVRKSAYHSLHHIVRMLEAGHGLLSEEQYWAVWFHDSVYEPGAKDSEERSAEMAGIYLTEGRKFSVQLVQDIILDTKSPHTSTIPESELVLDLDLAGLASPWPEYTMYSRQVRQEFAPATIFALIMDATETERREQRAAWIKGRMTFLERYMMRDPFFYNEDLFDAGDAQFNMKQEWEMLDNGQIL